MQSCHDVRQRVRGRRPLLRPGRAGRAAAGVAVLLAVLWAVPAQAGAAGGDRLRPGGTLQAGQSISAGGDTLIMRANGNLVLYAPGRTRIWSSRTSGHRGARLVMRNDGNLVVVAPGGRPLWAAGTGQHGGSMLILQPDGNAVIYAPGDVALWSTNTSRQAYAVTQLTAHGWAARQFACLDHIWVRESGWNELAGRPAHSYGIPQANPGIKMAAAGPDWRTSPQTQIRWGEDYIRARYRTPCRAWAYWQVHRFY